MEDKWFDFLEGFSEGASGRPGYLRGTKTKERVYGYRLGESARVKAADEFKANPSCNPLPRSWCCEASKVLEQIEDLVCVR